MSNPIDPFDELANNEIFNELRDFAANPVAEDPQALAALVQEFASSSALPRKRWIKRLVIPTVTIVIAIPSLAYAGLLPDNVATDIKQIVHNVGSVVTKPIVAISNTITGNSPVTHLSPAPSNSASVGNPNPSESADQNIAENSDNNSTSQDEGQNNEGDDEQASVVATAPSVAPTHSKSSEKNSEKSSEKSSEKGSGENKSPIAFPSPSSAHSESENEDQQEVRAASPESSRTNQEVEDRRISPAPTSSARPIASPTSTSREREGEHSRVRPSGSASPISSPTSTQREDD